MKTASMTIRAALAALLLQGMAHAQTSPGQDRIFKPSEVNESAIEDALEINSFTPAPGVKTKGFRPSSPDVSRPQVNPGKASLLITFAVDSTEITPETRTVLDTVAKALQSDRLTGLTFQVEGHADPRGDEGHNQKLSLARAEAVVNYLVTRHGIAQDRLAPLGKGSSELMDTKRPDAPENRRVTLVTNRS